MKPEPYHFDLQRIFLGDLPLLFLGEVIFRTAIMYLYTLLLVRLLGKRGLGQLSPFDFVIVIALGSAVGDPMFYDDVPVLHGMAVITVVVGLQRALGWISDHNDRARRFINSEPRRLVFQGVVDRRGLLDEQLESEELFAALRLQGVRQLGEVELAYIEPSGAVSVVRRDDADAGRPLVSRSDPDYPRPHQAGEPAPRDGGFACEACGYKLVLRAGQAFPGQCTCCACDRWLAVSKGVYPP
jgi:uncharacterized membrane protein YcaP (DUF421 family)